MSENLTYEKAAAFADRIDAKVTKFCDELGSDIFDFITAHKLSVAGNFPTKESIQKSLKNELLTGAGITNREDFIEDLLEMN